MIEQLRIKCPTCGIILDVRNSRHEAVKRIVCPNCRKNLAVDFQEEKKPFASSKPIGALYHGTMRIELQDGINKIPLLECEHVEIRVVHLNDGNNKCLVRLLDEDCKVFLNGQQLQIEDQVALAKGDQLQIDNITLVYDKQGVHVAPIPLVPTTPKPFKERPFSWIYAAMACAVMAIAVVLLWHSSKKPFEVNESQIVVTDTVLQNHELQDTPKVDVDKNVEKKKTEKKAKEKKKPNNNYSEQDDYSLEQLAGKGDVNAQYEIGNRLIRKSGSRNVIRGLSYLRMAKSNGSAKAQDVLFKAMKSLQQRAENGDSVAYYILNSIK